MGGSGGREEEAGGGRGEEGGGRREEGGGRREEETELTAVALSPRLFSQVPAFCSSMWPPCSCL